MDFGFFSTAVSASGLPSIVDPSAHTCCVPTLPHRHRPAFVSKTALSAEWEKDWKEMDFEKDLAKLQKEAEDRLDDKIAELMSNIQKTGASGN